MNRTKIHEIRETGEFLGEANFDDDSLVVRNVTLLGSISANGYTYSNNAMSEAATLLEGASQYLNHPSTDGEANSNTCGGDIPFCSLLLLLHPPIATNDINPNNNTKPKHFIK